jgi:adenosylcobinamide amidohydrolase
MIFSSLFLCTLLVAVPYARAHTKTYTADLRAIGDMGKGTMTGKVVVFTAHGGTVAYAGSLDYINFLTNKTCAEEVNGK